MNTQQNEEKINERLNSKRLRYIISKGKSLIYPQKYRDWEFLVLSSQQEEFHCADVLVSLEFMSKLNNQEDINEVVKQFKQLNYGEKVSSRIRRIVLQFSKRGPDFWEESADEKLSIRDQIYLNVKRQENKTLEKLNKNTRQELCLSM